MAGCHPTRVCCTVSDEMCTPGDVLPDRPRRRCPSHADANTNTPPLAAASGEPAATLAAALPQAQVVSTDLAAPYLELGKSTAAEAAAQSLVLPCSLHGGLSLVPRPPLALPLPPPLPPPAAAAAG